MGENIEVKDVQKTEYLDKNGLDMLWAKVKENTHNQVEVERNRAITQETRIFETKADKPELDSYVSDTALKALDKQVDTLNAAISGKQDAGNYIPYKNIAPNNKYVIESSYSIEFRTDTLNNKYGKAFIGPQSISVTNASGQVARIESEEIQLRQSGNASGRIHSTLNVDSFGVYSNDDNSMIFKLNQYGIKLQDGDNNHVLTSNASTIDITEYALKSVYDEKIAALEARIAALEAKHTETA